MICTFSLECSSSVRILTDGLKELDIRGDFCLVVHSSPSVLTNTTSIGMEVTGRFDVYHRVSTIHVIYLHVLPWHSHTNAITITICVNVVMTVVS